MQLILTIANRILQPHVSVTCEKTSWWKIKTNVAIVSTHRCSVSMLALGHFGRYCAVRLARLSFVTGFFLCFFSLIIWFIDCRWDVKRFSTNITNKHLQNNLLTPALTRHVCYSPKTQFEDVILGQFWTFVSLPFLTFLNQIIEKSKYMKSNNEYYQLCAAVHYFVLHLKHYIRQNFHMCSRKK